MHEEDFLDALQTLLRARKWDGDAGNDLVFRSEDVQQTSDDAEDVVMSAGLSPPFCLIQLLDFDFDIDEPTFGTASFALVIGVIEYGTTPTHEGLITGAHEAGGTGSSIGRGIVAVCNDIRQAVGHLDRDDGITIVSSVVKMADIQRSTANNPLAIRAIQCEAEF